MRLLSIALLCLGGLVVSLHAEDKPKEKAKDAALTGTYTRTAGDLDLKLVFLKDGMAEYHVAIGDANCVLTCKYKVEKDVYSFEVTEFAKKGDFPVVKEKGYKFSMKLAKGDKKLTVSEFKGDDVDDGAKAAIEGDYALAK